MIYLLMVLMTGDQTRVEVRVSFPTYEACIADAASVTSKTKRYAGWAGATLITSECVK
jgi:hypothetical protein